MSLIKLSFNLKYFDKPIKHKDKQIQKDDEKNKLRNDRIRNV